MKQRDLTLLIRYGKLDLSCFCAAEYGNGEKRKANEITVNEAVEEAAVSKQRGVPSRRRSTEVVNRETGEQVTVL